MTRKASSRESGDLPRDHHASLLRRREDGQAHPVRVHSVRRSSPATTPPPSTTATAPSKTAPTSSVKSSDEVDVIDLTCLELVGKISTGGVASHMLELNADFTKAYVDSEETQRDHRLRHVEARGHQEDHDAAPPDAPVADQGRQLLRHRRRARQHRLLRRQPHRSRSSPPSRTSCCRTSRACRSTGASATWPT